MSFDSELLENIPTSNPNAPILTAGKKLVETPEWTFAARAGYDITEDLKVGLQAKQVDDRFGTDLNDQVIDSYTVVDLDLSYGFSMGGEKNAQIQFNVINLFDEEYYGNISSATGGNSTAFLSIGAPRTAVASFKFNF